jgi:hypothetical protein
MTVLMVEGKPPTKVGTPEVVEKTWLVEVFKIRQLYSPGPTMYFGTLCATALPTIDTTANSKSKLLAFIVLLDFSNE